MKNLIFFLKLECPCVKLRSNLVNSLSVSGLIIIFFSLKSERDQLATEVRERERETKPKDTTRCVAGASGPHCAVIPR
jgi:hypothetical protein